MMMYLMGNLLTFGLGPGALVVVLCFPGAVVVGVIVVVVVGTGYGLRRHGDRACERHQVETRRQEAVAEPQGPPSNSPQRGCVARFVRAIVVCWILLALRLRAVFAGLIHEKLQKRHGLNRVVRVVGAVDRRGRRRGRGVCVENLTKAVPCLAAVVPGVARPGLNRRLARGKVRYERALGRRRVRLLINLEHKPSVDGAEIETNGDGMSCLQFDRARVIVHVGLACAGGKDVGHDVTLFGCFTTRLKVFPGSVVELWSQGKAVSTCGARALAWDPLRGCSAQPRRPFAHPPSWCAHESPKRSPQGL